MRVLIADYDFFSAIGGGQTLYRRIVERNPQVEFWYPSRGRDVRDAAKGKLPANARPYSFDPHAVPGVPLPCRSEGFADPTHGNALSKIALPIQGMVFDAVDVPSFFPCTHLVRPILSAYGIAVGRVATGLVGWPSVSVRHGYGDECSDELADKLRTSEELAIRASDVLYAIEGLYADESSTLGRPLVNLALSHTLEAFPAPAAQPAGEGPPDIWYIGRLDRTKGPDLFLDMVAQVPRALYRNCYFAGPDNRGWTPNTSWSEKLIEQAARLGLDAQYRGQISDAVLRAEVYGGRSVLVVPSRSDVINYVALEALSNGCPILLSKHAGATEYLRRTYPEVLPTIIDPEDAGASGQALAQLLTHYDDSALALRRHIRSRPLSDVTPGFMRAVYDFGRDAPHPPHDLPTPHALMSPAAAAWRPLASASRRQAELSVVVTVRDRPAQLAATLASLAHQTLAAAEVVVVDDGSRDPAVIRDLVGQFPGLSLIRQGRQGPAHAANRGWAATGQSLVAFVSAGDLLAPDFFATALDACSDLEKVAAYVPNLRSSRLADPGRDYLGASGAEEPPDPGPAELRSLSGLVLNRSVLHRLGGLEAGLGAQAPERLLAGLAAFGQVRDAEPGAAEIVQPWLEATVENLCEPRRIPRTEARQQPTAAPNTQIKEVL